MSDEKNKPESQPALLPGSFRRRKGERTVIQFNKDVQLDEIAIEIDEVSNTFVTLRIVPSDAIRRIMKQD